MLALRIPPDIVALLVAAVMWGAAQLGGDVAVANSVRRAGIVIFLASGVALIASARVQFARRDTTFSPMAPGHATALVVDGAFRLSRNPMYLGTWCILFAVAVYWSNVYAAIASLAFVLYIDRFQIRPEEDVLRAKFGTEYDEYRRRVRRWL